ncbi:MAG TPA: hypothetical protein VF597_00135 [Candidatus Saccharimonadales bacterium]|jgi:hypothetical protein
MGQFWEITKRLLQGTPAFVAPPKPHDDWDDDSPTVDYAEDREAKRTQSATRPAHPIEQDPTKLYGEDGVKHFPKCECVRLKSHLSGTNIELWATIANQSKREVYVDKLELLGRTVQLDRELTPGEQHEFMVYRGPFFKHDDYTTANLYYRDDLSGDYVNAVHSIEYHYDPSHGYEPVELNHSGIYKDI